MRPHGRWGAALYAWRLKSMRTQAVGPSHAGETPRSMAGARVSPATEQMRKIETPRRAPSPSGRSPGWPGFPPCNGAGEAFQHEFTAFQTAENLIVLIVEAASRIANPVAQC